MKKSTPVITEGSSRFTAIQARLLQETLTFVKPKLNAKDFELFKLLLEANLASVGGSDQQLSQIDTENFSGSLLSQLRFFQEKTAKATMQLRLFNPQPQIHGWYSAYSVVETMVEDSPFLVDSFCLVMAKYQLSIYQLWHPVIAKDGVKYSIIQAHVDRISSPELHQALLHDIEQAFQDVRLCVTDWQAMHSQCQSIIDQMSPHADTIHLKEASLFLAWLLDNHFTFIGYRYHSYGPNGVSPEVGLGILRDPSRHIFDEQDNVDQPSSKKKPTKAAADVISEILHVHKANIRSQVHRNSHYDVIVIDKLDGKGGKIGEHLICGLFTASVYNQSVRTIPYLRQKIQQVLNKTDFTPTSHNAKSLLHVLENYPRDELFQISVQELLPNAVSIVDLGLKPQPALFIRVDRHQRHVSALVFFPRDRFTSALRVKVGHYLASEVKGELSIWYTQMNEESLARVLYIFKTDAATLPKLNHDELNQALKSFCYSWIDQVGDELRDKLGDERGHDLAQIYENAFPPSYTEDTPPLIALSDITEIELLRQTEGGDGSQFRANLYQPVNLQPHQLSLRLYCRGEAIALSAIVPILENAGLRVQEGRPYRIEPSQNLLNNRQKDFIHLYDFSLETADAKPIHIDEVRLPFHDLLSQIWQGRIDNDGLNGLIFKATMTWPEILIVRCLSRFLQQLAVPFTQTTIRQSLLANGSIIRLIIKLFFSRHDPSLSASDRVLQAKHWEGLIAQALESVSSLDEDRILRRFLSLVKASLRTNIFQSQWQKGEVPWVAIKFASPQIEEAPKPVPLREIFVYSTEFEAIHLRFGLVARGGLRWSDRRDDFRTEILGLVKAQQVKNSVIVPVGAKGGFVLKQANPADRQAWLKQGVACYQQFIAALLDITDNYGEGGIIPPPQLVRHDGDDPYLVVAADKGTATFSDYANQVSLNHGFWLGDAFASGGSAGYDHKIMGITACGAWEAVKRHFHERGHDCQSQEFSAIGVGDMGGDVFGNGMLLSPKTKLIAAFNHLHIFIDPNPNIEAGFQERQRLFKEVKGWDDYNTRLISQGGGVWLRSAKSIKLPPEAQEALGFAADSLTPSELIRHILKAKVDLLFFGGIGTYVKHSHETHADVGDRANDALRVNATDLRVAIIGEGANLGMTQRARVEFALRGGAVNTDAIDNSAGVDCSDHEVNLKILLGEIVRQGDLTLKQRNTLLASMTEDVAALVLRDNYQQTQSLSVSQSQAATTLDRHQRLIRSLERQGHLERSLEYLPEDEEINERSQQHNGLTRPELAVLLAYAKNVTYQDILASTLPDQPWLERELMAYFPSRLQQTYAEAIRTHQLRREIIATSLTNSMLNRAGPEFVMEVAEQSGASVEAITKAFWLVRDVFDLRSFWQGVEAADGSLPSDLQLKMFYESRRTLTRMSIWFLKTYGASLDVGELVQHYRPGLKNFTDNIAEILPTSLQQEVAKRCLSFSGGDAKLNDVNGLATRAGQLKILSSACDIVRLTEQIQGGTVIDLGRLYHRLSERFQLDRMRSIANRLMTSEGMWNRLALGALIDDLWGLQFQLTREIAQGQAMPDLNQAFDSWLQAREPIIKRIESMLADFSNLPTLDLAMLSVVTRELRCLITL